MADADISALGGSRVAEPGWLDMYVHDAADEQQAYAAAQVNIDRVAGFADDDDRNHQVEPTEIAHGAQRPPADGRRRRFQGTTGDGARRGPRPSSARRKQPHLHLRFPCRFPRPPFLGPSP